VKANRENTIVLVAIVPRKKDWEILRTEHWYRIPVKKAPCIGIKQKIPVVEQMKHLAFYQPKLFGQEKWAVNYYTEVKGVKIEKRIDLLPDEPNHIHCNEDYYKIIIGELKKLPHPIPSKRWRRIIFIPTTLQYLLHAKEINDLYLTSPIEEKLYTALKKANILPERQIFVYETERPYCLDFALLCRDGNLNVECDGDQYHYNKESHIKDQIRDNELTSLGWSILRFPGKKIIKTTKVCVPQINKTLTSLGGIDKNTKLF
jgi:very-short-patch-repair endonuclease